MKVSIYLVCYNEKIYLPITVSYYKSQFPDAKITILDNYSTDNSVDIAKMLGCNITYYCVSYDNKCNNIHKDKFINEDEGWLEGYKHVRNNFWTDEEDNTWIITQDMDEFLCINDFQLEYEDKLGTTIILTEGYNMIGDSKTLDLSDVNLYEITRGYREPFYDKRVCFKKGPIQKMNFCQGQHTCKPEGNIVYSNEKYYYYHLKYISDKYLANRYLNDYTKNNTSPWYKQWKDEESVLKHLSESKSKEDHNLKLKPLNYYMKEKVDYKNIKLPSIILTGGNKLTKKNLNKSKITKNNLKKLKITQIKLLLKMNNLPIYGNKDKLITRYLKYIQN